MRENNIFFVSINSQRLKHLFYNDVLLEKVKRLNCDLFVFDIVETLNGIFFNEKNIEQQYFELETIVSLVKEKMLAVENGQCFVRYSEYLNVLNPYLSIVYKEYFENKSFERHTKSQIFKNLQPKLRAVGILNHKSLLIELLVPYLLSEIAFYLFIYDTHTFNKVYGFEPEMGIITAIREGKYLSFNSFVKNKIPYQQIQIEDHVKA